MKRLLLLLSAFAGERWCFAEKTDGFAIITDPTKGGGLYYEGEIDPSYPYEPPPYLPSPLRSLKVNAQIVDGIGQVTMVQEFQTPAFFPDEFSSKTAVYQVPLDELAAVTEFRAEVDDRTIEAVVKEREEARKEFEEAIEDGKNAYLAEQTRADIFHISVGNIPKGKLVRVTLVYVMPLEAVGADTLRFVFPTDVAPRYEPFENSEGSIPGGFNLINDGVKIELDVSMATPIETILSNTHDIEFTLSDDDRTASIQVTDEELQNRDIVILLKNVAEYEPQIYVESSAKYDTTAIMLSIVPDISQDLLEGSTTTKSEFLFVIDRSGSMEGSKMEQTKKAMFHIVDKIPEGSIFNFVGFGTSFEPLFQGSRQITDESAKSEALSYIENMDADFSGTDILAPLTYILEAEKNPTYERLVFVLTDGEVSNTDDTIEYVRFNRSSSRVFTLGIGNHVSALLVRGIARAGRGTAEFVDGNSDAAIEDAVSRQMEVALTPALSEVNIKWTGVQPKQQTPFVLPLLMSGNRFLAFYLIEAKNSIPDSVRLSSSVLKTDATVEYEVVIDSFVKISRQSNGIDDSDLIHKIACRSLIRDLEERSSKLHEEGSSEDDIKKEIVRLGLKYQIASSETSFVAVDNEGWTDASVSDEMDEEADFTTGTVKDTMGRNRSSSISLLPKLLWSIGLAGIAMLPFLL